MILVWLAVCSQPISDVGVFKNPVGVDLSFTAVLNNPTCKEYLDRGGPVVAVM